MFGGEYKSRPKVSLGGASRKEKRTSLIHRNQSEREKREELRNKNNSALKIQAFIRGYWIRQNERNIRRREFDVIMAKSEVHHSPDIETIHSLLRYLLFFYSNSKDSERLITTCQLLLKINKNLKIQDYHMWTFQIKQILSMCSRYLKEALHTKTSFAIPLRVLEVFTSNEWYTVLESNGHAEVGRNITIFLVKNGYFRHLRLVMEDRIPASLEFSSGVSTPLADTLLDLILRPIKQACAFSDDQARTVVLCSFVEDLFVPELSEQIKFCLLPKLQDQKNLPFDYLLQSLKTSYFLQSHANINLLYCILTLAQTNLETLLPASGLEYLDILLNILKKLPQKVDIMNKVTEEDIGDSDDESACSSSQQLENIHVSDMIASCMHLLNLRSHVQLLLDLTMKPRSDVPNENEECLKLLCLICNSLIFDQKSPIHETRLLLTLAFNKRFLKKLWDLVNNASLQTSMGKQVSLLQMIAHGNNLRNWEAECIAPLLAVFCFLFSRLLFSLHDTDFYPQDSGSSTKVPFTLQDLSNMGRTLCDVTLGVIDIINHEIRTTTVPNYSPPSKNTRSHSRDPLRENGLYTKDKWNSVLEAMTLLVKQLYSRDTRLHYCPTNCWLSSKVDLNVEMIDLDMFFKEEEEETEHGDQETRDVLKGVSGRTFSHVAILEHIPFVIPFVDRVKLFQRILSEDNKRNVGNMHDFLMGPSLEIRIRRNSLYQDAFDELGGDQDLKQKVHVKLINLQGLEEAGVDGGGLFREFLNECLKAGFDQNIGFFTSTNNQLLYPNPQSHLLERNVLKHYYFLGRMLGKAIYENMLVELPFASFFLCKLLSKTNADVDINNLESLDPEMYRNLLFLKDCSDVEELALNFTVVNNNLGKTQVVELKPGGKDIIVTNQNRIEYIHLMADYRLNKQIRPHCNAFRSGLSSVIDISWLRMFDHNEIQVLISGAQVAIDVQDLKNHTTYSGGLNEDHICVQYFWQVVSGFDEVQRRQLLKFVTSCSRPPLLGFKDLYPPFTIHTAGVEDRLPTASTCVNLLKLPEYKDLETMRQKLLYSLESGAGFELS